MDKKRKVEKHCFFRSKQRFSIHSWENKSAQREEKEVNKVDGSRRYRGRHGTLRRENRRLESIIRSNKDRTRNDVARL